MRVTSNGPFETNVYCGKILITFAKNDEEMCEPLFNKLLEKGIKFEKNALDQATLGADDYQSSIYNLISESACYVVAGSQSLFENDDFVRLIMFQAGYAEDSIKLSKIQPNGIRQKVIFINIDENFNVADAIKGTPYDNSQNINKIVDIDSLIETLEKSFVLEKYDFYEDKTINTYVTERMKYHRICININLCIDILKKFEPSLDEAKIKNRLKGLESGVKLLQFGHGTPNMDFFIFENEYKIAKEYQFFPSRFSSLRNRTSVTCIKDNDGRVVRATLSLEFIIPIHLPLGTSYKSFVYCNDMLLPMMRELLKYDFSLQNTEEIDMFEKDNRIFFNIDFKEDKLNLRKTLDGYEVGNMCNFCYAG